MQKLAKFPIPAPNNQPKLIGTDPPKANNELRIIHDFTAGIAIRAYEAVRGLRDLNQLARWLTPQAYRDLSVRAELAARGRRNRGITAPVRQSLHIGAIRITEPCEAVRECVVVVHEGASAPHIIAIRLEYGNQRWRGAKIGILSPNLKRFRTANN